MGLQDAAPLFLLIKIDNKHNFCENNKKGIFIIQYNK